MVTREQVEQREYDVLSDGAAKAAESKGRMKEEPQCEWRTVYQRDRDRIVHSKSLRRLMHKTQVFLSPEGDHFRTRLTHTLDVSQISRTIARGLALNEDLTEAIALGHDLGHTPFGHNGEEYLDAKHPEGFRHNEQSLRVVDYLESNDRREGLNLTYEVRDGILNHTGDNLPFTMEGQVVRFSDRIAYINHDIDDAIRAGIITVDDLPEDCIEVLGRDHRSRINTLVSDLITNSQSTGKISLSEQCFYCMDELRTYMFQHVYKSKIVKQDEELEKIQHLIFNLYDYFCKYPGKLSQQRKSQSNRWGIEEVVKDYIAGMTDRYAINLYNELFVPKGWKLSEVR